MNNEEWKPCFRYEGIYEVSNLGRVRRSDGAMNSKSEGMSTAKTDVYGNPMLTLKYRGRSNVMRVDKLVAMAFLEADIKSHIHHKNGDIKDCRADNLEVYQSKKQAPFTLTHEIAMREFQYDPETGVILRVPPKATKGTVKPKVPFKTGCVKLFNGKKYIQISIKNQQFLAHRLAMFIMNGEWPNEVDHEDGNGLNNAFSNLRECTHAENCRNVRFARSEDEVGIRIDRRNGRWFACAGGKCRYGFATREEAILARNEIRAENGFHENHGKQKDS